MICQNCTSLYETDKYGDYTSPTVHLFGIDDVKENWECHHGLCDNFVMPDLVYLRKEDW